MRIHESVFFERLDAGHKKAVLLICSVLQKKGFESWLVGGAVRDLLMGRRVKDLDIATSAPPRAVQSLFPRVIPTGIKHGTVTVLAEDTAIEVTTFRTEQGYSDGRHPDQVSFSQSLEEDLMRRDFTINAIAYDPLQKILADYHNGRNDIENKVIRTIGSPMERFLEDGLRPVRACRFSATLGFTIATETMDAIGHPDILKRASSVAMERFTDELLKAFRSPMPVSPMIRPLVSSGLMEVFIPKTISFPISLGGRGLELADACTNSPAEFRMALWLSLEENGASKEELVNLGRWLRLPIKFIRTLQVYSDLFRSARTFSQSPPSDESLRRILSEIVSVGGIDAMLILDSIDPRIIASDIRQKMKELYHSSPLQIGDLAINGKDLHALELKGPKMGEALRWLLDLVLEDPEKNRKEKLLEFIEKKYK